jgi:hypothetical protein
MLVGHDDGAVAEVSYECREALEKMRSMVWISLSSSSD